MIGKIVPVWPRVILFVLLAVLAACAAPTYDEQTDKQIAAVQQETDAGLVKLITLARKIDRLKEQSDPASRKALAEATLKAGYEANVDFYDKVDSDLTSLELRMTATPDLSAAKLGESIKALRDNIDDLRKFHADHGTISASALVHVRTAINQEFKTLIHYELNLKSGRQAASS
jgi:TRAP-type uncharacterized transport system substrate-binding protein